jgi:hypothetical protein
VSPSHGGSCTRARARSWRAPHEIPAQRLGSRAIPRRCPRVKKSTEETPARGVGGLTSRAGATPTFERDHALVARPACVALPCSWITCLTNAALAVGLPPRA